MESGSILKRHFDHLHDELLAYAKHTGLLEHSYNKGAAREGIVRILLENNLPKVVEIKTGELIDHREIGRGN